MLHFLYLCHSKQQRMEMKRVAITFCFLLVVLAGTASLRLCGRSLPAAVESVVSIVQGERAEALASSYGSVEAGGMVTRPEKGWPSFFDMESRDSLLSTIMRFNRLQTQNGNMQRDSSSLRHVLYMLSLVDSSLVSQRCDLHNRVFAFAEKRHRIYYVYAIRHIVI